MKKLKMNDDVKILVINETIDSFFRRGKDTAKTFDEKKHVSPRRVISFEDPLDLINFLTEKKLNLVASVRKKPRSISDLAKDLKRSRAAIDKDVQLLESVGIVKSKYIINPGHGKCKIISATDANPVRLQVQAFV